MALKATSFVQTARRCYCTLRYICSKAVFITTQLLDIIDIYLCKLIAVSGYALQGAQNVRCARCGDITPVPPAGGSKALK